MARMKFFSLAMVLTLALLDVAQATTQAPASKRSKVIDFEDEVVEGLNKRPLDSLNQISERNKKRKKPHLYRKRVGFRTEVAETLRVMQQNQ